jgi:hypothetical protein
MEVAGFDQVEHGAKSKAFSVLPVPAERPR